MGAKHIPLELDANDLENLQVRYKPQNGVIRFAWKAPGEPVMYRLFRTVVEPDEF